MENITLGQIAVALSFVVGLITSILYLKKHLKEWVFSAVKEQFDALGKEIGEVRDDNKVTVERLKVVDLESTKNYLVYYLSKIERGEKTEEIEKERFWEQFGHYTKAGGNSYIKQKVEQLKREGKL